MLTMLPHGFCAVDDKRKSKAAILVLIEIAQEEGMWVYSTHAGVPVAKFHILKYRFFCRFALYRGLLPVLFSLFCSNFLYFYTFNGFKTILKGNGIPPSTPLDLLFGYLSGQCAVLPLHMHVGPNAPLGKMWWADQFTVNAIRTIISFHPFLSFYFSSICLSICFFFIHLFISLFVVGLFVHLLISLLCCCCFRYF